MTEKYVVIAEFKDDGALVYETYLKYASYDNADGRMRQLVKDPNVTKVAMARLVYVTGHPDLVEKDPIPSTPIPF